MALFDSPIEQRGNSTQLVVFIHGWIAPSKQANDIRDAVAKELPDADILMPQYHPTGKLAWLRGVFSNSDAFVLTGDITALIDEAVTARQRTSSQASRASPKGGMDRRPNNSGYDRIILVGFSLGALLARAVFLRASGAPDGHGLHSKTRAWADRVERIILVAGANRGWSLVPRPEKMSRSVQVRYALVVFGSMLIGRAKLMRSIQRGRPFVVDLRLGWIHRIRNCDYVPLTVQLLGNEDDIVSRDDNIDLQCGRDFVYLEVPESNHLNVIDFSGPVGSRRKRVFLTALLTNLNDLPNQSHWELIPALSPDPAVDRVVFLMHGIRDFGEWTIRLRDKLNIIAADRGVRIEVIPSSYGYFPMLLFLSGIFRQKNVLWFMDEYVSALARFPKAKFYFVGHSNGTYLLTSSLRRYRSSAFDRAVLAGSVVPRKFPWDRYVETRIKAIRNYVATRDIVVGVFPGMFELLGSKEIGTAGHNGFTDQFSRRHQVTYVEGGHAAAIAQENFDSIVAFVLSEQAPEVAAELKRDVRESWAVIVSKLCWVVCAVLALFLLAPLALLLVSGWPVKLILILCFAYLAILTMLLLTA